MEQDKHSEQFSAKNGASLNVLAQMLRGCSPDDQILAMREETTPSLGSLQRDMLSPIKKKLKLEGGLQEGSELKTNISAPKDDNGNVTTPKREEAGPNDNVKLEDSHKEELARQLEKEATKAKRAQSFREYYHNNKERCA
jgi:hypothetical protein